MIGKHREKSHLLKRRAPSRKRGHRARTLLVLLVAGFVLSCQFSAKSGRTGKNPLPELVPADSANHRFVYTNKKAGFFFGNSRRPNSAGFEGWTVNEQRILRDYHLLLNGRPVPRRAVREFRYSPVSFIRRYQNGLTETFTLLDTVNAILVKIQLPRHGDEIALVPVLPDPSRTSADTVSSRRVWIAIGRANAGEPMLSVRYHRQDARTVYFSFWYAYKPPAKLSDLIVRAKARERRIRELLARQGLRITPPQMDQALKWSLLAADALVTRQRGAGIWAGLPWFNNYWGRDTFIGFDGALLVNGHFTVAAEILKNFARFQQTDRSQREYGRIPNRVTNREIIYNTTDGTWWFVRAFYQYYLSSGDERLVRSLLPAVQWAVRGAWLKRVQPTTGLLTHKDAETWMDAKGGQGAWSPRGNRAVEVQALWYTALQIAARLDSVVAGHRTPFADSCRTWATKVKRQFNRLYWDAARQCLFDHLNSDGSPDTSLRPNQIFAVTVPDLPGVEPLLSAQKQRLVARCVTERLTTEWGVLSLWYRDRYFHPYHHFPPYYVPDEAYHNGLIWTWLAGPVIQALLKFDQLDAAAALYRNEAWQILHLDAIGNYSELLEPVLRKGARLPEISGTVAQAWSVAEFNRNFYRDWLGYRPDVPRGVFSLAPKLPPNWRELSVSLPFGRATLRVQIHSQNNRFTLVLQLENGAQPVTGQILLPGSEQPLSVQLSPESASWSQSVRLASASSPEGEIWSLAKIPANLSFSVLRRPPYHLATGREVYFPASDSGRVVLSARDALNDDRGPNGRYVYPQNPAFKPGILDIKGLKIYDLGDAWGVRVDMRNLTDPGWHPEYGFQLTFLAIALRDTSLKEKTGRKVGRGAGVTLPAGLAFNRILYVGGGLELRDGSGKILMAYHPTRPGFPLGDPATGTIRFKIKKSFMPGLNAETVVTVLCGAQDDHGGGGIGEFRAVEAQAGEWHGGGAEPNKKAGRVYDRLEVH